MLNYFRKNQTVLIGAALIIGLAWGYEILGFNRGVDDELLLIGEYTPKFFITEGRWGLAIIFWLLGNPSCPVVMQVLSLLLLSLSWLIVARYMQIKGLALLLTLVLCVTSPIYYLIFSFDGLNPSVAIALFFMVAVTTVFWFKIVRNTLMRLTLVGLVAMFVSATYQPVLLVGAVLVCAYAVNDLSVHKVEPFRVLMRLTVWVVCTIAGVIISVLIWVVLLRIVPGCELSEYAKTSMDVLKYGDIDVLCRFLTEILPNRLSACFLAQFVRTNLAFFALLCLAGIICLWRGMCSGIGRSRLSLSIMLAITGLMLPFLIMFLRLTWPEPFRTMPAFPFSCSLLVCGMFRILASIKSYRIYRIAIGMSICSIFVSCMQINQLSYVARIREERDSAVVHELSQRIHQLVPREKMAEMKLVVWGVWTDLGWGEFPNALVDATGMSAFGLHGYKGTAGRVCAWLRSITDDRLQAGDADAYRRAASRFTDMPIWPDAGAIRIVDDLIIVKFSDNTFGNQEQSVEFLIKEMTEDAQD